VADDADDLQVRESRAASASGWPRCAPCLASSAGKRATRPPSRGKRTSEVGSTLRDRAGAVRCSRSALRRARGHRARDARRGTGAGLAPDSIGAEPPDFG
jgi:hypothetical protein